MKAQFLMGIRSMNEEALFRNGASFLPAQSFIEIELIAHSTSRKTMRIEMRLLLLRHSFCLSQRIGATSDHHGGLHRLEARRHARVAQEGRQLQRRHGARPRKKMQHIIGSYKLSNVLDFVQLMF